MKKRKKPIITFTKMTDMFIDITTSCILNLKKQCASMCTFEYVYNLSENAQEVM